MLELINDFYLIASQGGDLFYTAGSPCYPPDGYGGGADLSAATD